MTAAVDHVDQLSHAEIEALIAGMHHDPHSVLGAHAGEDGVTIRVLRPLAESVTAVLADGSRVPMSHLHQGDRLGQRAQGADRHAALAGMGPEHAVRIVVPAGNEPVDLPVADLVGVVDGGHAAAT